jgi:hypothetical protein
MLLERTALEEMDRRVHYFGQHVAFDAGAWRTGDLP